jgi:uncharacterized Zn finger protein (UPF0148 family)
MTDKINCNYCGNTTYIAILYGRVACSYCGAGIKDRDIKREEEIMDHYEKQMEAQVKVIEKMSDTIKETTRVAAEPIVKVVKKSKKKGSIHHGSSKRKEMSIERILAQTLVVLIISLFLLGGPLQYVYESFDAMPYSTTSDTEDVIESDVLVGIKLILVNATDGAWISSANTLVEIHNPSGTNGGQLLNISVFSETRLVVEFTLIEGKSYEAWFYAPFMYDGELISSFVAQEDILYEFMFYI